MIADRIKELRRVRAGDILANPSNYRTHPDEQKDVMQDVLERIGFAGALLARELDDGTLVLIDGHLRRDMDHEQIVPVLVTDLTEQEARELLAVYDPISAMAGQDDDILRDLLAKIEIEDGPLSEMLAAMDEEVNIADIVDDGSKSGASPWDRMNNDPAEGVTFTFGSVCAKLSMDTYEAFRDAVEELGVGEWMSEQL